MLPVVDKPAIQYVVEEAVAAGLHDVLMVTGRNKNSLENHFDRNWELEAALEAKGDGHRLDRLRESTVARRDPLRAPGRPARARATPCCAAPPHVGDEPFAVLLGDDLIDERDPLLPRMIEVQRALRRQRRRADGGAARAGPPVRLRGGRADRRRRRRPGDRPRREARPGRGAEQPRDHRPLRARPRASSTCCASTPPGRGGEIQLTDALRDAGPATGHRAAGPVHGRGLPRPPLRHRRPARLPQGRGPARLRARGPRPRVPQLAARPTSHEEACR